MGLNFIRLRRVVITLPIQTLLRGENDSKQSNEIQALRKCEQREGDKIKRERWFWMLTTQQEHGLPGLP